MKCFCQNVFYYVLRYASDYHAPHPGSRPRQTVRVPVSEGEGEWRTMNGSAWAKLYNRRTERGSEEKNKQVHDGMWHWHSVFRKSIHHSTVTAVKPDFFIWRNEELHKL